MNSRPVWCYRDRLFQSQRGDYKKEEYEEEKEETICQETDFIQL